MGRELKALLKAGHDLMKAKQLRQAAEYFAAKEGPCFCCDGLICDECRASILAKAWLADHPADEDEPATPTWMEDDLGIGDSFNFRMEKRYELCNGVRVMFFACEGPRLWRSELWVGNKSLRKDLSRGDVRRLLAALGIDLKQPGAE